MMSPRFCEPALNQVFIRWISLRRNILTRGGSATIKYKKEAATFRCRQGGRKRKSPVTFLLHKGDAGFGAFHLIYIILQERMLQVNVISPNS